MTNVAVKPSILDRARANPLLSLMIIAGILRLLAVIFAKGYMASDDHFVVIRPAWDWLNGIPTWFNDETPVARGVLYQYSIYAMMWLLKGLHITDPSIVMYVNRFLHALLSMSLIPMVYLALKKFADERAAWFGGMLVSVHFMIPFFAVRNLVEVVSQPFLFAGVLIIESQIRKEAKTKWLYLAGILLGIAFMIRIQTALCPMGVAFILLVLRKWKALIWFSLGALTMLLVEGLIDYLSFGMFLSSVIYSLGYQSTIVHSYITNPWYTYLFTLAGVMIPPFSLLIFPWIGKTARRLPVTFWATIFFFVGHSLIPQKQERFLLPILPLLIFLLAAGWSIVKWRDKKWVRGFWNAMWITNLILLPVGLFNYSQKARVEPLLYLENNPDLGKIIAVTIENPIYLPHFYIQRQRDNFMYIFNSPDWDILKEEINTCKHNETLHPYTHVIIFTHKNPEEYENKLEAMVGELKLEKHITPSLADWLLHKMNPKHNHSKESWVYSIVNNDD